MFLLDPACGHLVVWARNGSGFHLGVSVIIEGLFILRARSSRSDAPVVSSTEKQRRSAKETEEEQA